MAETYRAPNMPNLGQNNPTVGINQAPTPAAMPKSNPLAGMDVSDTARGLYVDPTPAFQPSLEFIGGQRKQANERYAQNKADIANIFGNLTQVNRESQARVNEQFTKSIADQQMQTAERVAQARLGQQQTQEAAVRAMDERGGGPMGNLLASPVAVEAERGIGDMNAYQQIWAGQQGAIRGQTEQDLMAAQRGLGYQQVQANQGLQRSLEDTLNQLAGQEVGVRSELAQAIYGGKSKVAEANYNEVLAEKAAEEARRIAAIRGAYDVQQAAINAQNKIDLANINAANRVQNYGSDSLGISRRLADFGVDPGSFWAGVDSVDVRSQTNPQGAFDEWRASNPRASTAEVDAARDWFSGLRYQQDAAGVIPQVNLPR